MQENEYLPTGWLVWSMWIIRFMFQFKQLRVTRVWELLLDPDMKEEFFLTVYLSCVNPEVKGGWTERPRLFIMSLM